MNTHACTSVLAVKHAPEHILRSWIAPCNRAVLLGYEILENLQAHAGRFACKRFLRRCIGRNSIWNGEGVGRILHSLIHGNFVLILLILLEIIQKASKKGDK